MKSRYRNLSFLAEVLVNVLVFSFSFAVLVSVFARASSMARHTREESLASTEVYALYETVKVRGIEGLPYAYVNSQGNWQVDYDENWRPMGAGRGAYRVVLYFTQEDAAAGTLQQMQAVVNGPDREAFYRLETAFYTPGEGGGS